VAGPCLAFQVGDIAYVSMDVADTRPPNDRGGCWIWTGMMAGSWICRMDIHSREGRVIGLYVGQGGAQIATLALDEFDVLHLPMRSRCRDTDMHEDCLFPSRRPEFSCAKYKAKVLGKSTAVSKG